MKQLLHLVWLVVCGFLLAACGGSGAGGSAAPGTLELQLVDAALPGFKAIYVTVDHIDVHPQQGDWETVLTPMKTVNLLELVNGVQESFAPVVLPAGPYTQLRLVLGGLPDAGTNLQNNPHPFANYFISDLDQVEELKVPSGLQTGIKLVGGFTIASSQTTSLVLDFDASRSVVRAGNSGQHLLKPTIKVVESAATVRGTVLDEAATGLPDTLVSAQITGPAAGEISVSRIVAGTLTDSQGDYALFLNPGGYQLVAFRSPEPPQAWLPACLAVTLEPDQVLTGADFVLGPALSGTLAGTVAVANPVPDEQVVLSIRQTAPAPCAGQAELVTLNTLAGPYQIDLPAGDYQLVASFAGNSLSFDVSIAAAGTTTQDVAF